MTVTVSLEEIRAYEKLCSKWHTDRMIMAAEFFVKNICFLTNPIDAENRMAAAQKGIGDRYKQLAIQWEATHPFPKLIPDV